MKMEYFFQQKKRFEAVSMKDSAKKMAIKWLCFFIPFKRLRRKIQARFKIASKRHLKKLFLQKMGYPLNLNNPQTYNEKMNWLKFNENTPLMTQCADKYMVRQHIKKKGFEEILVKLYGAWDRPEDIVWGDLPEQFVLKTNNDSGSVWIVKNKQDFDKIDFFEKVKKSLNRIYGVKKGEFYYADISPKIIAEEYLEDETGELTDYKLACHNGMPKYFTVHLNRSTTHEMASYDLDWNEFDLLIKGYTYRQKPIPCPRHLRKMLKIGKALSKEFTFARIDFYVVNDRICFGEITFWSGAGFTRFIPGTWDKIFGDDLNIRR